jgi:hypothetical protein
MTAAERRRKAEISARGARLLLRDAAKLLDGLGETAHRNAMSALVATDDVIDAIEAANELDAELALIEEGM